MVEDKEKIGFGGSTFAWKDKLKDLGFKYDPEYQLWLIETPEPSDLDGLLDKIEDYGFPYGRGVMGEPERERMCGLCL